MKEVYYPTKSNGNICKVLGYEQMSLFPHSYCQYLMLSKKMPYHPVTGNRICVVSWNQVVCMIIFQDGA